MVSIRLPMKYGGRLRQQQFPFFFYIYFRKHSFAGILKAMATYKQNEKSISDRYAAILSNCHNLLTNLFAPFSLSEIKMNYCIYIFLKKK